MAELIQAVDIVKQGQIKPIVSQTFPLEEAEKAHQLIQENKITGRAALIIYQFTDYQAVSSVASRE
jgi:D-arabinose 1-dehydrogenase-like Zn-dependent alcohol dehydrogenase